MRAERNTDSQRPTSPTNNETQLYNAEHALNGKTCARGQSRVDLDFMDVVAQRKIELAESILFHIGADRFRTGRNHGFAGRSFGQRVNVAHFGRHDNDFLRGLTDEFSHTLTRTNMHLYLG